MRPIVCPCCASPCRFWLSRVSPAAGVAPRASKCLPGPRPDSNGGVAALHCPKCAPPACAPPAAQGTLPRRGHAESGRRCQCRAWGGCFRLPRPSTARPASADSQCPVLVLVVSRVSSLAGCYTRIFYALDFWRRESRSGRGRGEGVRRVSGGSPFSFRGRKQDRMPTAGLSPGIEAPSLHRGSLHRACIEPLIKPASSLASRPASSLVSRHRG